MGRARVRRAIPRGSLGTWTWYLTSWYTTFCLSLAINHVVSSHLRWLPQTLTPRKTKKSFLHRPRAANASNLPGRPLITGCSVNTKRTFGGKWDRVWICSSNTPQCCQPTNDRGQSRFQPRFRVSLWCPTGSHRVPGTAGHGHNWPLLTSLPPSCSFLC